MNNFVLQRILGGKKDEPKGPQRGQTGQTPPESPIVPPEVLREKLVEKLNPKPVIILNKEPQPVEMISLEPPSMRKLGDEELDVIINEIGIQLQQQYPGQQPTEERALLVSAQVVNQYFKQELNPKELSEIQLQITNRVVSQITTEDIEKELG